MDKKRGLNYIDEKKETVFTVNDRLWDYAETAFREFRSVEEFLSVLEAEGFRCERGVGNIPTAFRASFGESRPVIGLLAEYDALDGLNQKAGSVKKEPTSPEDMGKAGQGCGHSAFGAAVLGAALGVKEYLSENPQKGTVVLFGCPGEEGGSGKAFMAREGVFQGLDAALTWHPAAINSVVSGSNLANYQVMYRFYGTSAHAASVPEKGRSALDAVELMNMGVQFLREHIPDEARVHYAITNPGGFSPNVVQARADVLYLMRAPKTEQLKDIYERVNNIAQGAALMTGTRVESEFIKGCSEELRNDTLAGVLYNNMKNIPLPEYTEEEYAFYKALRESVENKVDPITSAVNRCGEEFREEIEELFRLDPPIQNFLLPYFKHDRLRKSSTDVGDVTWNCPTAHFVAATAPSGTPGHSWQYVACGKSSACHKGVLYAAKVLAASAIDLMEDEETVEKAKEEFKKRLGGRKYQCPIPEGIQPRAISEL